LDGHLVGNFQSKGKIVIGPAASVKGDIVCKNADMEGKYEGNIQVLEILNIKSKASIHGEVICGKLSVEPGAEFSATCVMKPHVKNMVSNGPTPEEKAPNRWLALINMPIQMGVIVFLFAYLGKWLDGEVCQSPYSICKLFTLLGVVLAFYNINRQLKEINKSEDES